MKRACLVVTTALALCGAASAQTPAAPAPSTPTWRMPAPTPAAPAPTARAPFGCDARAPNVCYFRIFYTRGDRIVILAAGMKEKNVPVIAGGDYCMTLNKAPVFACHRKAVNDRYNS